MYRKLAAATGTMAVSSVAGVLLQAVRTKTVAVCLGPSGMGALSLILNFVSLVSSAASLGSASSVVKFASGYRSRGEDHLARLTATTLLAILVPLGCALALLAFLFAPQLSSALSGKGGLAAVLAVAAIAVPFTLGAEILRAFLQANKRIGDLATVNVLGSGLAVLTVVPLVAFFGLTGAAAHGVIEVALICALALYFGRRATGAVWSQVEKRFDVRLLGSLLSFGALTALSGAVVVLAFLGIRWLIVREYGFGAAGLYQAGLTLSGLVLLLRSSLMTYFLPHISEARDREATNEDLETALRVLALMVIPAAAALLVLAPLLVRLFLTSEFLPILPYLGFFAAGAVLSAFSSLIGNCLLGVGLPRAFVALNLLWGLLALPLTGVLMAFLGEKGPAIAYTASYAVTFLASLGVVAGVTGYRPSSNSVLLILVGLLIIAGTGALGQVSLLAQTVFAAVFAAVLFRMLTDKEREKLRRFLGETVGLRRRFGTGGPLGYAEERGDRKVALERDRSQRRVLVISNLAVKVVGNQSLYQTLVGYARAGFSVHFLNIRQPDERPLPYALPENVHIHRAALVPRWLRPLWLAVRSSLYGLERVVRMMIPRSAGAGWGGSEARAAEEGPARDRPPGYIPAGPDSRVLFFLTKAEWIALQIVGFWKGWRLARSKGVDLIYGYEVTGAPVAWLLGRLLRVPTVTRFQGTFLAPLVGDRKMRWRFFEQVAAMRCPVDLVVMGNDGTRGDEVLRTLGVPESRFRFYMNGVEKSPPVPLEGDRAAACRKLGLPENAKIVLSLSKLAYWKRVDRAIAAMPHLLLRIPEARLVIAGAGSDLERLVKLARRLGVESEVLFLNGIPHSDVAEVLSVADVFVSLYDLSNLANPVLEAMVAGKPIVIIDDGSLKGLLADGESVVTVPPDPQPESVAEAVARLLEDAEMRGRLGENAREAARKSLKTWEERLDLEVSEVERILRERAVALQLAGSGGSG